ncbi:MAG: 30S ribosome-binding factor RbfA [Gammaproteobacteria bacterium]
MPRGFKRTERLNELVRRELSVIIQREITDPRLGMVSISAVEITNDLSYAKIYVTILVPDEEIKTQIKILNHAAPFLRTLLAQRVKMRIVPQLLFIYDESIRQGEHLTSLIDSAIEDDERKHIDEEES